jgi:hypothetical protein
MAELHGACYAARLEWCDIAPQSARNSSVSFANAWPLVNTTLKAERCRAQATDADAKV